MAVLTEPVGEARRKRPAIGRSMGGADHTHPEMGAGQQQRTTRMGDFMKALEGSVYGEARTGEAQAEAGVGVLKRTEKAPVAKVSMSRPAPAPGANAAQDGAQAVPASFAIKRVQQKDEPDPEPETPPTEREGGPIPMEKDVWKSQADAAEFERRMETLQLEDQIRQLRDVAEHHGQRSEIKRRQAEAKVAEADLSDRTSELRLEGAELLDRQGKHVRDAAAETAAIERRSSTDKADLTRREGEQQARDAERAAEIANLSADEKRAHFEAFKAEADAQIADLKIAHLEEAAQMRVVGASRGVGGGVVERHQASEAMKVQRQVGRIGTQVEARRALKDIGVAQADIRAEGALAKAEHARTTSEIEAVLVEWTGEKRAVLMEKEGDIKGEGLELRADEQRIASELDALNSENLRIQSAGLFLEQDAEKKAGEYASTAADITDWGLENRPAIPDYIAIGKEQERAQALRNLGAGLGIIGGAVNLFRSFF